MTADRRPQTADGCELSATLYIEDLPISLELSRMESRYDAHITGQDFSMAVVMEGRENLRAVLRKVAQLVEKAGL